MIIDKRSSGILLHISSLPSAYGIGDLGPEAYKFAGLLAEAGQRYWQILPLNPTEIGMGNSPYSSHSAFAGNPLFISPDMLLKDGLITRADLKTNLPLSTEKVNYLNAAAFKQKVWETAFRNFKTKPGKKLQAEFNKFKKEHEYWLTDFSYFAAFKAHFGNKSWVDWDAAIRQRKPAAMQQLAEQLHEKIEREQFLQFLFYRQWYDLKNYCAGLGIYFIGDMPFYVSHDSADVWANPTDFKLNKQGRPIAVSGVPPDFFSETGQLWGTPVYNWDALEKQNYNWWLSRIAHNLELFSLLRLDHFRAFSAYWEVPAGHETAANGKWKKSPGRAILTRIREQNPKLPIIAEDLGEIDQPVRDLIAEFGLPGMRLLLFAFGDSVAFDSSFLPHNHVRNCVVYTGTHDNATAKAWYQTAPAADKKRLKDYSRQYVTASNVHNVLNAMAMQSVAQLAVLPMQDVLGLGKEAIFNIPSTSKGNWEWRLQPGQFSKTQAKKLRKLTELYGRC